MIVGDIMRRNAELFPSKTAVVCGDVRLTFAQVNERANRLANALLSLGMKKGDCVAILLTNCHRYLEFPHVLAKAGLVGTTLNFRLHPREWVHILNNSEASVLIVGKEFVPPIQSVASEVPNLKHLIGVGENHQCPFDYEQLLHESDANNPAVAVHEDEILYRLYTSGTTGRPKGAMLTHKNLTASALNFIAEARYAFDDVYLACMPLYHSVNIPLLSYVMRGCTTVVMNFEPERVLQTIQQERVTSTFLVPTMIGMLLDHPARQRCDLSTLHTIFYAAAPMPVPLLRKALSLVGSIFCQMYGLTETSTLCTILPKEDHLADGPEEVVNRLGSVGREIMAVRLRVVDEQARNVEPGEIGEIIVKGDTVMKGYWKQPEATAETLKDGWMYTGDMATLDEAGYIYLVDRKHDMIISGGANIYPREVENVIYTHPAVQDAAVVGVPDDTWGEAVLALVVRREDASCTEEAIIQHCTEHLAGYKKPRTVEFIDTLPRDLVGKLDRKSLREKY